MTDTIELVRRPMNLRDDYWPLLRMQQLSWSINFGDENFSEEAFRISLRAAQSHDLVFAYEYEGALAGWLWLSVTESLGNAHIRHVQVAQSLWGRGLGKAIIDDAISESIAHGCVELTLNVTKSNRRAMALYARQGFVLAQDYGKRQHMTLTL